MKSLSVRAISIAVCLAWALVFGAVSTVYAQTNYYSANGTQYPIVGSVLGDQMFPDAAISPTGGMVVWQDNATDGDGWGISAQQLDSTLSGTLSPFRVNVTGAGDQENPRVALLKGGGAVIAWQGGTEGYQRIFARLLTSANTFLTTTDLVVSVYNNTNSFQVDPAVAVLNNSNIVVVWSSFNHAGANSLLDVYAKILSPTGLTISNEFLVNQFTNYNQRSPGVAALANGGFVVTWVSEQETAQAPVIGSNTTYYTSALVPSVSIYARLYQSSGLASGSEFQVDTGIGPCANPRVAAASDGTFMVAWSGRNLSNIDGGWGCYARPFSAAGVSGTMVQLNANTGYNQFAPRLAAVGLDYLAVWTSVGQNSARQAVNAQFVHSNGSLVGSGFLVNTPTLAQQMQPVVASDGASQFLAVWTGYNGLSSGFDLSAQRYINVGSILQPMSAPYVWVPFVINNKAYQPELLVSWAPVVGLSVADYEVYVDGASTPTATVTTNSWIMTAANGLAASSTHSFAVDYVTTDGRRSPLSPPTSGTTWSGVNDNGIPFEWMEAYYGADISTWPNVNTPLTPGGPTLYQVFLSGGNPLNSATWLEQQLVKTSQGMFLTWNTQQGATYQVQYTSDFTTWSNLGSPRFAAGTNDSVNVSGNTACYYRVVLLR